MSYYGSIPKLPEIEVGSAFVVVRDKYHTRTAQILRADVDDDGTRRLTLDRSLGRYSGCYVERTTETPSGERKWQASGAFTTELTWHAQPQLAAPDEDDES